MSITTGPLAPTVIDGSSSCCAPAVAEETQSNCCGPAEAPGAAASSCCSTDGAAQLRVGLGLADAVTDLAQELRDADSWPNMLPAWLAATEKSLAGVRAWHSTARDGADAVFLPGFVFDAPGLVDADPRTYLGWEPATGQAACCGTGSCGDNQEQVDAMDTALLFPALVLGSPLGFRSDVVTVGNPGAQLTADLVDALVPAAVAAGVRSIVAPWVADLPANGPMLAALHARGANISFWGEENFIALDAPDYQAHLAALPYRRRRRIQADNDVVAASGVRITRVDGPDLRPLVGRITQLTLMNRRRYDGGEEAEHITGVLHSLIDDGADVRAHLAYLDDRIVGSGVTIRQGRRLVLKWAGFDYEALGERSGLYFSFVLDRPLQDAYAEGLGWLEAGPGADQAKRLRGYQPRPVYTALFVADESVRDQVASLQGAFGGARRAALGAESAQEPQESTTSKFFSRLRPKKADAEGCCS